MFAPQSEASEAMESAAAAMGVLRVIGSHLSRGSYWRESYHTSAAPSFLALLTLLLPCQPRLHPKVPALPDPRSAHIASNTCGS